MTRLLAMLGVFFIFHASLLFAQGATKAADVSFEYPELLVTPSASDRLGEEAKLEKSRALLNHLPVQASALTTAVAGFMATGSADDIEKETKRDNAKYAALAAQGVGIGWLGFTAMMSFTYKPNQTGLANIKGSGGKNKRDQLARERGAEEELEYTASTYNKIKWLSIASNFLVAGAVAGSAEDDMVKATAGFASLAAFAPLLFPYRAETVWDHHQDYKKRIYGPIVDVDFGFSKRSPVLTASLRF